MARRSLHEWALNVTKGETFKPRSLTEYDIADFMAARYDPPTRRTRRALLVYLESRNPVKYRRLQKDFEWAKKCLQDAGMNPEDARFLL